MIADMIEEGRRKISLKKNPNTEELQEINELLTLLGDTPELNQDEDPMTQFTAKEDYNRILSKQTTQDASSFPYKCVWVRYVPPKQRVFVCYVLHNAIPIVNNLLKKGCDIQETRCSLCSLAVENVDHLLLHCGYTKHIWEYFSSHFGIRRDLKPTIKNT